MLVAALGAHGVRHLSVAKTVIADDAVIGIPDLIARLAHSPDPRLRAALIPLFLRRLDLADQVGLLEGELPPPAADVLRHFYTAAVYLQRLWLNTLRLYLGDFPLLPDYFGQTYYHLSAPTERHGEIGLRGLARLYEGKTGFDWLTVYGTTMNLFLQQLSLEQLTHARHDG